MSQTTTRVLNEAKATHAVSQPQTTIKVTLQHNAQFLQ